jgi:hypothetical protein
LLGQVSVTLARRAQHIDKETARIITELLLNCRALVRVGGAFAHDFALGKAWSEELVRFEQGSAAKHLAARASTCVLQRRGREKAGIGSALTRRHALNASSTKRASLKKHEMRDG